MASRYGFSLDAIALIRDELAKRGIGPEAAAGAIAGLMGESGANLDPTSFNSKDPGGGSGGIGQWNRERLVGPAGMLAYARAAGVPVDVNTPLDARKVPLAVQAGYLGHELDTTYANVARQLQAAHSSQEGLNAWVNTYENPADKAAAIAQRQQYLAPVAAALKVPGTTLNTSGGPSVGSQTGSPSGGAQAGVGGVSSTPGTSSTGQPQGALAGWKPGSAAEKSMQAAAKTFGWDQPAGGDEIKPPQLPMPPPAQAMGGPMMAGPGGVGNVLPRMIAQQALAQAGYRLQPSLADFGSNGSGPIQSRIQPPGTTLNSPAQWQMQMMMGGLSPYDLYGGM